MFCLPTEKDSVPTEQVDMIVSRLDKMISEAVKNQDQESRIPVLSPKLVAEKASITEESVESLNISSGTRKREMLPCLPCLQLPCSPRHH